MKKFLYDIFAQQWYRGGSIYLYSDPHFGDVEMYQIRFPYGCTSTGDCAHCDGNMINCVRSPLNKDKIQELDEWQIKNINARVGKNDTIIFLGDIGDLSCLQKIRGYKILIMGNHEKGASNYKRLSLPEDNHLFDEVYEGPVMINDRLILSHEPINTPPYLYNIHGHDHARADTGPNHLNVCAEYIQYTPISLGNLLKHGLLRDVESIHRTTIDKATAKKRNKKEDKS